MIESQFMLISLIRPSIKNRTEQTLENLALRQQPAVLNYKLPHSRPRRRDRELSFPASGKDGENSSSRSRRRSSSDGIGKVCQDTAQNNPTLAAISVSIRSRHKENRSGSAKGK
jgi:hypothetical protein